MAPTLPLWHFTQEWTHQAPGGAGRCLRLQSTNVYGTSTPCQTNSWRAMRGQTQTSPGVGKKERGVREENAQGP